jgi:hypothetical protein
LGFNRGGGFPIVCFKESANVRGTGDFDVLSSLENVKSIEGGHEAFIDKGRFIFARELELFTHGSIKFISNGWVPSSKSKVVGLMEKEDRNIVEAAGVNVAFMSRRLETKVVKNTGDVFFPKACSLGVSL